MRTFIYHLRIHVYSSTTGKDTNYKDQHNVKVLAGIRIELTATRTLNRYKELTSLGFLRSFVLAKGKK